MNIFISWSGHRSKFVAESLREWLPKVIQSLNPWISSSDVTKGSRWQIEIAQKLEKSNFGIICLTPENMNEPWILFESGALSKTLGSSRVCPLLIELTPTDITGPLSQFQLTKLTKDDFFSLLKNINKEMGEISLPEERINETFEKWWPDLSNILKKPPTEQTKHNPKRSDRNILEEILYLSREATKHPELIESEFFWGRLQYFLTTISPKEEWVLRHHYGLWADHKTMTVKEMAKKRKTTQKSINELHTQALQELFENITSYLKKTDSIY
jgi:hypothetical protein